MTPPLPPELLSQILRTAQADLSPSQSLLLYSRFSRVCTAWRDAEFKYRVLGVAGQNAAKQAIRALDKLNGSPAPAGRVGVVGRLFGGGRARAGAGGRSADSAEEDVALQVRTLYVRLEAGKKKAVKNPGLVALLSRVSNVTGIELHFFGTWDLQSADRVLGEGLAEALGALKKVKRVWVAYGNTDWPANLSTDVLKRLCSQWRALEALTITRCNIWTSPWSNNFLSACLNFHSLTLIDCHRAVKDRLSIVFDLPLTTRHLAVNDGDFFDEFFADIIPLDLHPGGIDLARRLQSFTWTDGPRIAFPEGHSRGHLDNFVSNLAQVTHLKITPVALSDVSALAALKSLTHLELRQGIWSAEPAVRADEVVRLCEGAEKLERLTMTAGIDRAWAEKDKETVRKAAKGKAVISWI